MFYYVNMFVFHAVNYLYLGCYGIGTNKVNVILISKYWSGMYFISAVNIFISFIL